MTKEAEAAIAKLVRHAKDHERKWLDVYHEYVNPIDEELTRVWESHSIGRVTPGAYDSGGMRTAVFIIFADAASVLQTYPDSVYILDLHPNVVRLMAASGNVQAIFLEGAILAMYDEPIPQTQTTPYPAQI